MDLASFSHGKRKVRIGKVRRRPNGVSEFVEYVVGVQLEGATEASFTKGDNTMVVATDTVKNICYVVAKHDDMNSPEEYGLSLARKFLDEYSFVTGVRIEALEKPWSRAIVNGAEHVHGFLRGGQGEHVGYVEMRRQGSGISTSVEGRIEKLDVLKTTQSGWEKFYRDRYTVLPDTNERILATTVSVVWKLSQTQDVDYSSIYMTLLNCVYDGFFGDPKMGKYSPGVQNTQYLIAHRMMVLVPEISEVSMVLPNIHFLPCNIPAFVKNNIQFEDDVFIPTDEPQGEIRCTLKRPTSFRAKY
mmetsp:Transcript_43454/g.169999  ORF Transcript_43454/g.169999 Transcript_43454/m.169999 type:complete len:301 (-) Transcript_43454:624-1526(-)